MSSWPTLHLFVMQTFTIIAYPSQSINSRSNSTSRSISLNISRSAFTCSRSHLCCCTTYQHSTHVTTHHTHATNDYTLLTFYYYCFSFLYIISQSVMFGFAFGLKSKISGIGLSLRLGSHGFGFWSLPNITLSGFVWVTKSDLSVYYWRMTLYRPYS